MSNIPEIKPATCKSVVIEGLALMKIIKHCREKANPVYGRLIGIEDKVTRSAADDTQKSITEPALEIMNSIPEPDSSPQYDYIAALRDTFHDGDLVGLYSSDYFGEYHDAELISILYEYQINFPNSVLVVFDPIRTQKGFISLRALRLSKSYMELHTYTKTFSQQEFSKFGINSPADIFEQVPLYIHNHHLCHTYLLSLADSFPFIHSIGDRFNTLNNNLPETMIEATSIGIDQYTSETESYNRAMFSASKQRAEIMKRVDHLGAENSRRKRSGLNPLPEPDAAQLAGITDPSYLKSALLAGRLVTLAHDLNALSTQSYKRHMLLHTLMKPEEKE